MRFFKTFLATLAAMAIAYAIAAAMVNPRRELIGHRFPALQPNSRAAKLALLDSFSVSHPVDALVLGSSRSMHLPPELLSRLTGRHFFNLAVFAGRPEDFLALYRAVIARGVPIRSVVIGVDPDAIDPIHPPELELQNNPRLSQALNGKPFDAADWLTFAGRRATGLFTVGYVRDVLVSARAVRHPPTPMYTFEADGRVEYPKLDRALSAGAFSLADTVRGCSSQLVGAVRAFSRSDSTRLTQLRELLAEAKPRGDVIVWIPPMQPDAARLVAADNRARENLRRSVAEIRRLAEAAEAPVLDLSESTAVGRQPDAWYDCVHYRGAIAEQISQQLAATLDSARRHGL
jgi:hypothetical protein